MHVLLLQTRGSESFPVPLEKSKLLKCPCSAGRIAPMRHCETISWTRLHHVTTVNLPRFFTGIVKSPPTMRSNGHAIPEA
jgi:hypothetical protein